MGEEEQERRFRQRIDDPVRQWKLSPMDLESYRRWWDYTTAYDEMIRLTDTSHAPWWIVPSDDKKAARINCISHLLQSIPYEKVKYEEPSSAGARSARTTTSPTGQRATWCRASSEGGQKVNAPGRRVYK